MLLLLICFLTSASLNAAPAEVDSDAAKGVSGLPLPRYASLRSNEVNMRTGPGTRYPILWVFTHPNLPVEITAEYEIWRRVRDPEGAEGWVHKSALSGKRTVIVTGGMRELRLKPDDAAATAAHLEMGATGLLQNCAQDWCKVKFDGIKGYLRKNQFWGAYVNEVFE